MSNPTWVTSENVKFNGAFDNAVVLKNNSGIKSLILWDSLSVDDQQTLIDAVNQYGGTTPLAGPVAGKATAGFSGAVGGTATGLSAVATATAGKATINIGGAHIAGDASGLTTTRQYTANVHIDKAHLVTAKFTGASGNTIQHVIDEINADLGGFATASLVGGNIVITSATTGAASSVVIYDQGFLCKSITGYVGISSVDGVAPRLYTATVTVDGVAKPVSVQGSAALTFTTLLSEINADLGVAATAALVGGNIVITSATTGLASSVVVTDVDLFRLVAGFTGITSQAGAVDLTDVFKLVRSANGTVLWNKFDVLFVGAKPAIPPYVKHHPDFRYFDGSVWKYLDNDAVL